MSRYQGRQIDDLNLWSNYIDIPMGAEKETHYWPKVQCPNPEHDTTKWHFQVNVQDGLVHCFAHCGISGTYTHAIKIIEGCDDRQARRIILAHAGRAAGKPVRRTAGTTGNSAIRPESLSYESFIPQAGVEYLDRRGITAHSIAKFGVGWCPETLRVVVPGRDLRGETRFLIKRAVRKNQHPKYLYSEGYPKTRLLFGAFDISALGGMLAVVEGSIDAIRLSQHGIPVVATLGTGISTEQARILDRLRPGRVYLMFDKDAAGVQGIEIAAKRIRKSPLFVCRYPRDKSDPAELTREEALGSIARALPLRKFKQRVNQPVRRLITYGH